MAMERRDRKIAISKLPGRTRNEYLCYVWIDNLHNIRTMKKSIISAETRFITFNRMVFGFMKIFNPLAILVFSVYLGKSKNILVKFLRTNSHSNSWAKNTKEMNNWLFFATCWHVLFFSTSEPLEQAVLKIPWGSFKTIFCLSKIRYQ